MLAELDRERRVSELRVLDLEAKKTEIEQKVEQPLEGDFAQEPSVLAIAKKQRLQMFESKI